MKALRRIKKQVDQGGVQVLPGDQIDRGGDDANILPRDHLRQVEEPLWNEQLTDIGLDSTVDVSVLDGYGMHAVRNEQTPNRVRPRFTG